MRYETVLKALIVAILAVFVAIVYLGVPARSDALAVHAVPSDGTATKGVTKLVGVKIHPSGNSSSVYIYDGTASGHKKAANLKWRLQGLGTNNSATLSDFLPSGDYIYCGTGTYVDIKDCSAELWVTGAGVTLTYMGSSSYRGWDAGNNAAIVAATTGATVTVSDEAADQLLADFPSDWQVQ